MAIEHGHLPKADPEQLDPELRRRFEVWRAKAYQDDNLFLTLARRPAVLDLFLAWVGFIYAGGASLDPALVELCRIRLAQRNQCVH
jgi:alkylhydroperoxidase family enzyme